MDDQNKQVYTEPGVYITEAKPEAPMPDGGEALKDWVKAKLEDTMRYMLFDSRNDEVFVTGFEKTLTFALESAMCTKNVDNNWFTITFQPQDVVESNGATRVDFDIIFNLDNPTMQEFVKKCGGGTFNGWVLTLTTSGALCLENESE